MISYETISMLQMGALIGVRRSLVDFAVTICLIHLHPLRVILATAHNWSLFYASYCVEYLPTTFHYKIPFLEK